MDFDHKERITIVTHDGPFHADDVCATALCYMLFGDKVHLIRTRDEDSIQGADIVFDVGMVYDPAIHRYDHHQKDGAGVRENSGIPYSSFGLIWKHLGMRLVASEAEWSRIDEKLVSVVDATDNGIQITTGTHDVYPDPYDVYTIIKRFRPSWTDSGTDTFDTGFAEACTFAEGLIKREILHTRGKLEAERYVRHAYEASPDKRIIILETYAPFDEVLSSYSEPLCVIYPSARGTDWIVKVVQSDPHDFESRRIFIPESWGGKRGEELERATGVRGAEFAHRNLFMAVAHTKEAILALAHLVLKNKTKTTDSTSQ